MKRPSKFDRIERARSAGRVTSYTKAKAARANGQLGGRPGNPEVKRIMQERNCSRQRAHQILKARGSQPCRNEPPDAMSSDSSESSNTPH